MSLLRPGATLCAMFALSCASLPPVAAAATTDYGHYILAVNHNATRIGRADIQWQRVEITNLATRRMDDLDPVSGDPSGTVLYVGRAPAGKYRLSAFKSVRGNMLSTLTIGARAPGMEFEVKPGAVVDAGTLIAFQMGTLVATARVPSSPVITAAGLAHLTARYRSLRGSAPISADFDAESGARVSGLIHMRPAFRGEPATLEGVTVAPAKLGNLAVHTAEGGWRNVASGVGEDLTAVGRSGGRVLVGTELGRILEAAAFEGPYEAEDVPAGTGPVRAFLSLADGRQVAVALRLDGTEVEGLRVLERAVGTRAWTVREDLPTKLDMPFVAAAAQGIVVQSHAGRLRRLDTQGVWAELETPLFLRSLQADGRLMALDYPPDVAYSKHVRVHESTDLGLTWTVLPGVDDAGKPVRAAVVATSDGQGGYRLLGKPMTGWLIQSDRFYRLPAGAQAWTVDAEHRPSCRPQVQIGNWTSIDLAAWWTVGATLVEACADGQRSVR